MSLPPSLNTSDPDAVYRFIGGRRRYNSVRQFQALMRRREVVELLRKGLKQAEIARRLGVHPSTISRDVSSLLKLARSDRVCPCCGQTYSPSLFEW